MKTPRILAFGGSLRAGSFNHRAAARAAEGAREAGAEVTLIRLRDYPMPLFDEDLETAAGMPEPARELKSLFLEHDGLLIGSPEYNSTITAALKNAIDWVSRSTADDEPPLVAFEGKIAAILGASPGGYGGSRGLAQLRPFLENIRVMVIEPQVTIPKVHEVIGEDGSFADEEVARALHDLGASLVAALRERAG
jgi:NAD(P)H-dependent FMN reductase